MFPNRTSYTASWPKEQTEVYEPAGNMPPEGHFWTFVRSISLLISEGEVGVLNSGTARISDTTSVLLVELSTNLRNQVYDILMLNV